MRKGTGFQLFGDPKIYSQNPKALLGFFAKTEPISRSYRLKIPWKMSINRTYI